MTNVNTFKNYLANLNPEQLEAVETIFGPVLLLAGPGSGKTQVLALRIANIISQTDTVPESILALTFTENATVNMQQRLVQLIGSVAYKIKISTFHNFSNEIIRNHGEIFAFARELKQIDDLTKVQILEQIISNNDFKHIKTFRSPFYYLTDIRKHLGNLKKEGYRAQDFIKLVEDKKIFFENNFTLNKKTGKLTNYWLKYEAQLFKNDELAKLYNFYETKLQELGLYDYDDMILFVNEALNINPQLLAELQEKYLFSLVDEYQDTNGAQNKLLLKINDYDENPNLFVVGDEDQSIFRFQGANIENILEYKKHYPGAKIITTKYNYRSIQPILDIASDVIKLNPERVTNYFPGITKDLIAVRKSLPGAGLTIIHSNNNYQELDYIIKEIKELLKTTKPEEIGILYRKNTDSRELIARLTAEGIEYSSDNYTDITKIKIFQKVKAVIEFLTDINNSSKLLEILHFTEWKLDTLVLFKVINSYNLNAKNTQSFLEYLTELNNNIVTESWDVSQLVGVSKGLLNLYSLSKNLNIVDFLKELLVETKIISSLLLSEDLKNLEAVYGLLKFAKKRLFLNNNYTLDDLLKDIESVKQSKLAISADELMMYRHGVRCLTVHKSKGLEFKYVFILKAIDKNWGNSYRTDHLKLFDLAVSEDIDTVIDKSNNGEGKNEQEEKKAIEEKSEKISQNNEERRLFYVAITRAKDHIYLLYSDNYFTEESDQARITNPTIFISDLNTKLITEIDNRNSKVDLIAELKPTRLKPELKSKLFKEFLTQIVEKYSLSATGLNDYLDCQLRFLYKHLLDIPEQLMHDQIVGSAIHKALEFSGRRTIQSEKPAELLEVILSAKQYLEKKLILGTEKTSIVNEVEELLTNFYPQYKLSLTGAKFVEKKFVVSLAGVPLKGMIDLILLSGKTEVVFADYKKSAPKSLNQILGNTKNSDLKIFRQICFYRLLATLDKNFNFRVVESKIIFIKPTPAGILKELTIPVADNDLAELKKLVMDTYQKILNLEFSQKCNKPDCYICNWDL